MYETLYVFSSLVFKALGFKPEVRGIETRSGESLNLPNPSGRPLTEISTGNIKNIMFLGSKVRPVRGAHNLTAIYEPIV
jgi:hypothetical protein